MSPVPTAPADDPDAWLDDVRRWYYGGNAPAGDTLPAAPPLPSSEAWPAGPGTVAARPRDCCPHCRQATQANPGQRTQQTL